MPQMGRFTKSLEHAVNVKKTLPMQRKFVQSKCMKEYMYRKDTAFDKILEGTLAGRMACLA